MNHVALYVMMRQLTYPCAISRGNIWKCRTITDTDNRVRVYRDGEVLMLKCGVSYAKNCRCERVKINEYVDKGYFKVLYTPRSGGPGIHLSITAKGLKYIRKSLREYVNLYVNSEEREIAECLTSDFIGIQFRYLLRTQQKRVNMLLGKDDIELTFSSGE